MNKIIRLFVLALIPAIMITACGGGGSSSGGSNSSSSGGIDLSSPVVTNEGTPIGPAVTKVIGSGGGTLASADGTLTVTVPSGAVSGNTTFSIQPCTNPAPGGIGMSYLVEPRGVTFAKPVTLTFYIPEAGVSRTSINGLYVAYHEDNGQWRFMDVAARDEVGKTLSLTTTHFCQITAGEYMWLSPRLSTVHEGTSEQLQIVTVNPLADLTGKVIYPEQAPAGKAYEIYDWSINGVVTGDAEHGRIWPTGTGKNLGTYTAPGSKPNPSTVAASVNLQLTNLGYTQLVAQINIGEPGTYTGNWYLISSGFMGFSASGTATVTPHKLPSGDYDDGIDMTNFDLQVTAVLDNKNIITVGTDACTCSDAAKTQTYYHVNEVTVYKIPYRMDWHFAVNWPVTCTAPDKSTYPAQVSISWRTYCEPRTGSDDGTWGIPLANPNRLSGVYSLSASCPAVLSTQSMSWDFSQ